jgi:hypothetical protein
MLYLKFGQRWNAADGHGFPIDTVGRQFNIFETRQECLNGHGIIGYVVRTERYPGQICVYPRLYQLLEENNTNWAANVVRKEGNPVHGPNPPPHTWKTTWCNVVPKGGVPHYDNGCVCGNPQCRCAPKITFAYGRSGVEWLSQFFDLEFTT